METTTYSAPPAFPGRRAADAILIVGHDGTIRSANRAAELLLGYEPGQLTNRHMTELWYSAPGRRPREDVSSQLVDLQTAGGDPLAVRLTTTPLGLGDDAAGDRLVSLMLDDRGRADDPRRLLHVQRLAGIGTLTASVAHELTSPLSVITAALANLEDEAATGDLTPEQLARYVDLMRQSTARAARIIEVLRNYAHNDGEASVAVTSAEDILRDALVMVEQQFRKRDHVDIAWVVEPGLETIVADHNRLTQVLVNLLLNARDAMQPGGGTIQVRFWPLAATGDTGLLRGNGTARDYFAFSVGDSGPGIAPDAASLLFEPFYTTKPPGAGTGLGLSISRDIIAQHGGRIWAENNAGGGATFIAVVPKRPK